MTQLTLFPMEVSKTHGEKVSDLVNFIQTRTLPNLPIIVSYGGGVNSTAMLIAARLKRVKIERIIFADTGNEKPETYEFLQWFNNWIQSPWYDYPPLPAIETVRYQPQKAGDRKRLKRKQFKFTGKVSLLSLPWFVFEMYLKNTFVTSNLGEQCLTLETLPSKAYGYGACSSKWKIGPIEKFLSSSGFETVIQWVGFHDGERGRLLDRHGIAKPLKDTFGFMDYPLIKWGLNQKNCEALCQAVLGFIPMKSACWFCPHVKPSEVLKLKESSPELYGIGCFIEEQAMKYTFADSRIKGLGRSFSWREIDQLSEEKRVEIDLFFNTRKCACTE